MRNKQRKSAVLVSVMAAMIAVTGCGQEAVQEVTEDVAIVEASNPNVGNLELSGEFIATISPDDSVYAIPKTTAEVVEVLVKAGDVVEEGQVLAILDDTLAQLSMKSAQITLDNAQRAYNLSYGEGASTLNDMSSDSTVSKAEDGVVDLQESLVDAMDSLAYYQSKLKEAEDELEDIRQKYDYSDDVDSIKTYAEGLDNPLEYQAAMLRYQSAATEDAQCKAKITQYKSAIDQCEETIEVVQSNIDSTYEAYSQAVTSNNISNGELREEQKKVSQNSIAAAQLSIEQAQESLKAYTITASISGVVETVNIDVHDFASASNPAFVISNKDTMVATFYVSEDVRNTFSDGQVISLDKDGTLYEGEIIEIASAIDAATGLFQIKAKVKGDTSAILSGTKAKVTATTYHANQALIVPYDCVYYDGTQAYLYTVVDGKARKTNVTTGLYDTENIVVTEGITKEDIVITTWSAQLREGVTVEIADNNSAESTEE